MHNDAEDFAQRLYGRIPAHYRVYDAEQGLPLLTLMRVVGEQAANLRQDLDALWDNFFIETCEDWAVPYIAAVVGTNLLAHPVGQSNRLDVRNTVRWRRGKGAPAMLAALSGAICGWPADLAEFFQNLGWAQHLNHLQLDHPLAPDLRDVARLRLIGRPGDPFAHAADLRPAHPLDQPRVTPGSLGVGRAAWGTPGRYQIKRAGVFVRRLQTFSIRGATPAAAAPGIAAPTGASLYTFDPLFRDLPLFASTTGTPIDRATFGQAPWLTFGSDIAVRQFGVLLAGDTPPAPEPGGSRAPFTFGGAGSVALDPGAGMRLMEPRSFQRGSAHFALSAVWLGGGAPVTLGSLSTLRAAIGATDAFRPGSSAGTPGRLAITLQLGRAALGWPGMPASLPARFPGAVLALRAAHPGALRNADGLYVYLPAVPVRPGQTLTFFVADDGSTYTVADLAAAALARASEGQVYPPRPLSSETEPATDFITLNRAAGGIRLVDSARFGGAGALIQADLFTGAFQPLGALATIAQQGALATYPALQVPDNWPALTYAPSKNALAGTLPEGPGPGQRSPLLSLLYRPLSGATALPPAEVIIVNRAGWSLLVYLPEVLNAPADGVRLFVADDGATYFAPATSVAQLRVLEQGTLGGLQLARAATGQVLPIPGVWPLMQRRVVAIDLCRPERTALLQPGELGVDPERGRFAFAPGDPSTGAGNLAVDYVEAFSDRVGARTFDRRLDLEAPPTRLVASSGDAAAPGVSLPADRIHASLADALAHATDGDIIEMTDSATYTTADPLVIGQAGLQRLTIRAAPGQRPCLAFYRTDGSPALASLRVAVSLDQLELNGLLISGGPLQVEQPVARFDLVACTLDPLSATGGSLLASHAAPPDRPAAYLLCRCITGGLRLGAGVERVTVADSIVDQRGGLALGGLPAAEDTPAQSVQIERTTVFGRVRCDTIVASECLFDDTVVVDDRQAGGVRFSRFEPGSILPRRFQCVPTDTQIAAALPGARCLPPRFNARRFGRPDYAQLATVCPPEILAASESGAEVGAFATALNTVRLGNLAIKLAEFLPVGLEAVVIGET